MYTYPNGLRCNAPETRVRLYEKTIPYLAAAMILAGIPGAIWLFLDDHHIVRSTMTAMAAWVLWVPFVVLMAYGAFVWWCKPIEGIDSRRSGLRDSPV